MKKQIHLTLAGLIIVSTLFIPQASAKDIIYQANGTLDAYIQPGYEDALIIAGNWRVVVNENYEVNFIARYLELNVNEEINGTIDRFTLNFDPDSPVEIEGSMCIIRGSLLFEKLGWDLDSSDDPPKGPRRYSEACLSDMKIIITSSEIVIEHDGGLPLFGGTTYSIVA